MIRHLERLLAFLFPPDPVLEDLRAAAEEAGETVDSPELRELLDRWERERDLEPGDVVRTGEDPRSAFADAIRFRSFDQVEGSVSSHSASEEPTRPAYRVVWFDEPPGDFSPEKWGTGTEALQEAAKQADFSQAYPIDEDWLRRLEAEDGLRAREVRGRWIGVDHGDPHGDREALVVLEDLGRTDR